MDDVGLDMILKLGRNIFLFKFTFTIKSNHASWSNCGSKFNADLCSECAFTTSRQCHKICVALPSMFSRLPFWERYLCTEGTKTKCQVNPMTTITSDNLILNT
jgi:hypothetical protein